MRMKPKSKDAKKQILFPIDEDSRKQVVSPASKTAGLSFFSCGNAGNRGQIGTIESVGLGVITVISNNKKQSIERLDRIQMPHLQKLYLSKHVVVFSYKQHQHDSCFQKISFPQIVISFLTFISDNLEENFINETDELTRISFPQSSLGIEMDSENKNQGLSLNWIAKADISPNAYICKIFLMTKYQI